MQRSAAILITLALLAAPAAALADSKAESTDRIDQCERDNEEAKAQPDVVRAYCKCMDRKMGGSVAQSVTQWEKTHQKESVECDLETGWSVR